MVKVELKQIELFRNWQTLREMKSWCREQYGKNVVGQTQQWRGTYEYRDRMYYGMMYYPVFYFATEKQATLFLLRWS